MSMYITNTEISCGIQQIDDIGGTYNTLKDLCELAIDDADTNEYDSPFYIFSDNTLPSSRGDSLKKEINDNKLGKCLSTAARKNPNSGNMIKLYIWAPDWKAVRKFVGSDKELQDDYKLILE